MSLSLFLQSAHQAWDEGAIGFADGLAENQSLLVLDLCANHIGDAGAAALARVRDPLRESPAGLCKVAFWG